jgi:hypothetical protein
MDDLMLTERERKHLDLLKARQTSAKQNVLDLAKIIQDILSNAAFEDGAARVIGGLAVQYDEALTKYKVYTQEIFELTT